jgi:glutathione S-transferase
MMKLYSGDLSPYSARVRLQIYAKGIKDITLERPADFGMPKFRETNPIGRIPVLDIDGDLMPESDVIAEYLEEIYPEPSMLGATPRETAHIRTLARIGDIYLMNNMFMLSAQGRAATRNQGIVDLLGGQVVRNIKALDRMIGKDVLQTTGVDNPIPANANVAAYWAAIQTNEHAARVLVELHRGLAERRELIRSGAFEKMMAAAAAAHAAAEAKA